jgi:hypothetical protein
VTLAAPAIADAQDARIRVERLVVVDDNGADRVLLRTVPGMSACVAVLAPDGTTSRVSMNTGAGRTTVGTVAEAAGLELYLLDGTRVGRLGTHNPELDVGVVSLFLSDSQGRKRIVLVVADDGTPSIQLLDANGNVTWSAR